MQQKESRNCGTDYRVVEQLIEYSLSFIPSDVVVEEITPPDDQFVAISDHWVLVTSALVPFAPVPASNGYHLVNAADI